MTKDFKGAVKEWEIARWATMELIKQLGDEGLKMKLPRKGLDTFCKHFEEMIAVQESSVEAMISGTMSFDSCKSSDYDYEGLSTKEELLQKMKNLDERMVEVLSNKEIVAEVDWWGEPKTMIGQISWQIMHEAFHFGQLIAFCHVLDIKVPQEVVNAWAMSGFEE